MANFFSVFIAYRCRGDKNYVLLHRFKGVVASQEDSVGAKGIDEDVKQEPANRSGGRPTVAAVSSFMIFELFF